MTCPSPDQRQRSDLPSANAERLPFAKPGIREGQTEVELRDDPTRERRHKLITATSVSKAGHEWHQRLTNDNYRKQHRSV